MVFKFVVVDVYVKLMFQVVVFVDLFVIVFKLLMEKMFKVFVLFGYVLMLEYIFEWLLLQGVEEMYVLVCVYVEMIDQYLKSVGWGEGDVGDKEMKLGQ